MGLTIWTEELTLRVAALWASKSAYEIAVELRAEGIPVTRNSIGGKMHRMGLKISKEELYRRVSCGILREKPDKQKVVNRPRVRIANNRFYDGIENIAQLKLRCVEISCATTFADNEGCWYPSDSEPTLWCGGPKKDGSSYCVAHHALVWVPPQPKVLRQFAVAANG